MIIDNINIAVNAHLHQQANNISSANIVRAVNNKLDYDISGSGFTSAGKFIHIVSSDFAYPVTKAKLHKTAGVNAGETTFGPFDGATLNQGAITVGMSIHGGGFGNTFGVSATITNISGYTGETDVEITNITVSTATPQFLPNDTRLYFGNLTGKYIASFAIPPGEEIIFEKKPLEKVFATSEILPSSGIDNTTETGIVFSKVR
ncbi:MAG: hypothetical protein GOVbin4551_1 [Prokaryotic dsDNA virus sp.]|nr:MAG: hypothetical protein GOVbin4551_1 [Prokaryotic dsDNA virus sp.]|tara:strand:- start:280 stop:891 length:612 start_codon:yes stop_codon:yes gene_type:complete